MFLSDKTDRFSVNAEKLIERMLSGTDASQPGAYIPTPTQAPAKSKKYNESHIFFLFLNVELCTIKKVMMVKIHKTIIMLIIIHEKSPSDGLIN
jgi:hypothetical protein